MYYLAIGKNCISKDLCSVFNKEIKQKYFFGNGFFKNIKCIKYTSLQMLNMFLKCYLSGLIYKSAKIFLNKKNNNFIDIELNNDYCYTRHIQNFKDNLTNDFLIKSITDYFQIKFDKLLYYYDGQSMEQYKDFVHLIDLLKECFHVDSIQMDVISTSVHNYKIDNIDFVYIPDMIIHKSKGWEITDESRNILTKIYNCKIERFF